MTKVLLTGATGYIGGRLLRRLQEKNIALVCFTRRAEALEHKVSSNTSIVEGDVQNKEDLVRAMQGVDVAYYLIHSMGGKDNFEKADRIAAQNFAEAARESHVKRIVYLGGLGSSDEELSAHLKSRHEVGEILKSSDAQTIEFRASIVIGSGSLSFELVRTLVNRLPILIMPKWVQVPAQPIWINDLLSYLEQALSVECEKNNIFEIGGSEIVSYRKLMEVYAQQMGLKRLMINVPVLTPYLSSLWLGLVTPVFARIGRRLVNSLKNPTVVNDFSAKQFFDVTPVGVEAAISKSIANEDQEFAETRWSDAISSSGISSFGGTKLGRRIFDNRSITIKSTPQKAFAVITSLGGEKGWLYANWAWSLRGFLDLLFGGVGIRRGRKHPTRLHPGDVLDWWRVEKIETDCVLLLRAEMKVPGRAWLEFGISPKDSSGNVTITQTAIFDPKGLSGRMYWYALYLIHLAIFSGMLKEIGKLAKQDDE
jgi:uncharacterized protein YbjT (DUF2867 family)